MDPWLTSLVAQYPDRVVPLFYHHNDPLATSETEARDNWYGVYAYPTMFVDGIDADWTYNPNWRDSILTHMTIESPLEFTVTGSFDPGTDSGTLEVEVYVEGDVSGWGDLRIVYVVSEDSVYAVQTNGPPWHFYTVRDMIPDQNGTQITLVQGNTYNYSTDFQIDSAWDPELCHIAVFVQDSQTKNVLQADWEHIPNLNPSDMPEVAVATGIPESFALHAPYPNPFNPETTVAFDVPTTSDVTVRVYDVLGRQVATLTEGRIGAGAYRVRWNAADQTSGVYFVKMDANGQVFTQKCLLVR